jgi:hypothetical protein
VWGQEPDLPPLSPVPPGWSFNPTANAFGVFSRALPNRWGYGVNAGGIASRWGSIVGVPVSGYLSPFVGLNLWRNFSSQDVGNIEAVASRNWGLGGRQDFPLTSGVATSNTLSLGVGLVHAFEHSDYGLGGELFGSYEGFSNIQNQAGSNSQWIVGFRLGWGAINPHRNDPPWRQLQLGQ